MSTRQRTTSSASTVSSHSSYAIVSDPEITSSFAASLDSAHTSDVEDLLTSPAFSSPVSPASEERPLPPSRQPLNSTSRPLSPGTNPAFSLASSYSSLESLHSHSGRLLTLYLEKREPTIWPSLIVGPAPEALSPCIPFPSSLVDESGEEKYNMDPSSLSLLALDLYDIRKDKEEAFEYFIRAWHHAHVPAAVMRLVTHYLPLQTTFETEQNETTQIEIERGAPGYYYHCIGRATGLARLYLDAGSLYLEGAAIVLLSSSYSALSSIRASQFPQNSQYGENGVEAWKRDREAARKYFERSRSLCADLDVPVLPPETGEEELPMPGSAPELLMPSIEIYSAPSRGGSVKSDQLRKRKTGKVEEISVVKDTVADESNTWLLYIPGLVGAGTALLVVGALSFSSWRRSQV